MKNEYYSHLDKIILRSQKRKRLQATKELVLQVVTLFAAAVITTLVFFNLCYRG